MRSRDRDPNGASSAAGPRIDAEGGRRTRSCLAASALLAVSAASLVEAHPLGNFTVNHYAGLEVSRDAVFIDYVLDMAEIPAFQEISRLDANGNDRLDPEESAAGREALCEAIRSSLVLAVGERPAVLTNESSAMELPEGAGGLPTLRLTCGFRAAIASAAPGTRFLFRDDSWGDRLGWREIVVHADGVAVHGDFATTSLSRRLTAYPDDLLSSPLAQRAVSFTWSPEPTALLASPRAPDTGEAPSPPTGHPVPQPPSREDTFTRLIRVPQLDAATVIFALAVSFLWGAGHALSPGHGKTMVGGYLVGSRGTAKQAVVLGLTVTLTHTFGVFALGLVTLSASRYVLPEQLYPVLSLVSGVAVLIIGCALFAARWGAVRAGRIGADWQGHGHTHHRHGADTARLWQAHPGEAHEHRHEHGPHGHTHEPIGPHGRASTRRLIALGVSGGLIPCPTALVVLLSAIGLGRVGFGLMLIVAFSAGLAAVLTLTGVLLVRGHGLLEEVLGESRLIRLAPLVGAALVILTGIVVTTQALAGAG